MALSSVQALSYVYALGDACFRSLASIQTRGREANSPVFKFLFNSPSIEERFCKIQIFKFVALALLSLLICCVCLILSLEQPMFSATDPTFPYILSSRTEYTEPYLV